LKIFKFIVIFLVAAMIIYAGGIFLGFNLPKPDFLDKGIEGEGVLKVTLLMDNNVKNPLPNIEVDVAKKPGPSPRGGIAATDEAGVATFKIKPGSYYIFFNNSTFPKNLEMPQPVQITVSKETVSEKTMLMTTAE
jgi:hypothetical protein